MGKSGGGGDRSLASSGGGSHLMNTSKDLAQPLKEDGHPKDFTPLLTLANIKVDEDCMGQCAPTRQCLGI